MRIIYYVIDKTSHGRSLGTVLFKGDNVTRDSRPETSAARVFSIDRVHRAEHPPRADDREETTGRSSALTRVFTFLSFHIFFFFSLSH